MSATWKPIPGHEMYEVSDQGLVRSWHRSAQDGPRIMKQTRNSTGYLGVRFDGANWGAHVLVLMTFVGPRPTGQVVRHLDGDHDNNHLSNLKYGTRRENNLDTVRHGRNVNAAATHCKRGHEFTPENTRHYIHVNGNPARSCKTCVRAAQQRIRAERKSAA